VRANLPDWSSAWLASTFAPAWDCSNWSAEGNLVLMRAVEGFDIHRGHRFSTYADAGFDEGLRPQPFPQDGAGRPRAQNTGDVAKRLGRPCPIRGQFRTTENASSSRDESEASFSLPPSATARRDVAGRSFRPSADRGKRRTYAEVGGASWGLSKERVPADRAWGRSPSLREQNVGSASADAPLHLK